MSLFRTAIRAPVLRTSFAVRTAAPQIVPRRFATQDYGSGEGDPKGEKPQEQGNNPREDLEHPGPPAPDVGQAKQGKTDQDTSGTKNLGSGKKNESGGTSSSSSGGSGGKSSKGKPTKLSAGSAPAKHEASETVKEHNEDMKQNRKAQSSGNNDDVEGEKVGKEYWKGELMHFGVFV